MSEQRENSRFEGVAFESDGQLYRWTSAILLGSLVIFSVAKPRIQQRMDEIQQRTTFQNGFNPQLSVSAQDNESAALKTREVGTLGGIQLILFIAFLITWFFGLRRLHSWRKPIEPTIHLEID